MDWPILSAITFLPLLGAAFIFPIRGTDEIAQRNAKFVALWTTVITFLISILVWVFFDPSTSGFQFEEKYEWLITSVSEVAPGAADTTSTKCGAGKICYHMGVDGISILFVILTTFLMPICILASWRSVTTRVREYMIAFLVLETLMIGVFCALDLVLFYLFLKALSFRCFLSLVFGAGNAASMRASSSFSIHC